MNTSSPAVLSLSFSRKWRKRPAILAASIGALLGALGACHSATAAPPPSLIWEGVIGDPNWTSFTNWTTGVAPQAGDDLQFSAAPISITNNNDFAAGTLFNSITFLGAAGQAYTLNGNAITLGAGGLTNLSSATNTISFTGITLGAAQSWNATAGPLNVTSDLDLSGFTLTVDGAQNTTISGAISGAGGGSGLAKSGAGTLTLTGTNSYGGIRTWMAGIWRFPAAASPTGTAISANPPAASARPR